jgi:hypothetical protein
VLPGTSSLNLRAVERTASQRSKDVVEYIGHWAERIDEWKKARAAPSSLLPHALEQLDAAIWLIGGGRYSQALILLHACIEALLKSELDKVHPLMIADRVPYPVLKVLLKEHVTKHPHIPVDESIPPDIDKSITFWEALVRVTEPYPELKSWYPSMQSLQEARNRIVHHRGAAGPALFVKVICLTALPFIEMLAQRAAQIDIEKLLGADIYREIRITRRFCEQIEARGEAPCSYALLTVRYALLYRDVEFPGQFEDNEGQIDTSDREYQVGMVLRRDVIKNFPGHLVEVDCKICGSVYAYAAIEDFEDEAIVEQAPHGLACAQCGLWITEKHRGLAAAHFGMVSAELIEKSLKHPVVVPW